MITKKQKRSSRIRMGMRVRGYVKSEPGYFMDSQGRLFVNRARRRMDRSNA